MHDSESSSNESGQLKDLDNLLKCAICYEYLKTTLMTPCSHNFCSYCIRQSLSYRSQCPACFEDISESQLRSNRVVDEFISIFTCLKGKLVKFFNDIPKVSCENSKTNQVPLERRNISELSAKDTGKSSSVKSCVNEGNHRDLPSNTAPSTSKDVVRTPQKFSAKRDLPSNTALSTSKEDVRTPEKFSSKREVQIPSLFSPKNLKMFTSNETRVPCPVCSVDIPEKNINVHLDACLKRSEEKRAAPEQKRKLLPKLVYHLLPDKDLRKKLHDLGLSTTGDRATLINRHKRYTLLYNSECDSLKPRSSSEIIKQMKKEEEDEKKSVSQVVKKLNVDRKADPEVNEEAQRQYLEDHKVSFQKLIEEARRNKEARKNCSKPLVPDEITIEETSSPSKNDTSKGLFHEQKLIASNKDGEYNHHEIEILSDSHQEEQTENINSKKVANRENKFWGSSINPSASKINCHSPNAYDVGIDDDTADYVSHKMTQKNKRRILSSPESSSNLLTSVTSPVLGNKCKIKLNRTPGRASSCKKDLTPDLRPLSKCVTTFSCEGIAGQENLEDGADSDSSSNHSASIMVYTGPDCDNDLEQSSPTKISSPISSQNTSPVLEKSGFDLGIEEILQNSEDFISLPVCRQSTRIRQSKRNSPSSESNARVLRKRVKIDDL